MHALAPQVPLPDEPLLLEELNHRVVNEFASAIAMISRVAARSGSDEVKGALNDAAQLLHNHAQLHRALQPPVQEALINAEGFLSTLCRAISRSKLDHTGISLELAASPLLVCADHCWRLGLIVSELVTNAVRHAFPGGHGKIRVGLSRGGPLVICSVADNGPGALPVRHGRGLRIVEELSRSLGGRFERKSGPVGSISTVTFPCAEQPGQIDGTARSACHC